MFFFSFFAFFFLALLWETKDCSLFPFILTSFFPKPEFPLPTASRNPFYQPFLGLCIFQAPPPEDWFTPRRILFYFPLSFIQKKV